MMGYSINAAFWKNGFYAPHTPPVRLFGAVVAAILVFATQADAGLLSRTVEVSVVPLKSSAPEVYGGASSIALGRVVDDAYAETPDFLGMGVESAYRVVVHGGRVSSVTEGVVQVLQSAGVLALSSDAASHTVNVFIRRNRFSVDGKLLRAEVFLEFVFLRDGSPVGRVLACGNAERKHPVVTTGKTLAKSAYRSAFNNALNKLLQSTTLAEVLGPGWKPGAELGAEKDRKITRISRDQLYGPTEFTQDELVPRVAPLLRGLGSQKLVLLDLEVKDSKYLKKRKADPQFASSLLPGLLRERLQAFYPGAFSTIERRRTWEPGEDSLVVSGEVLQFNPGRAKTGYVANLQFRDGKTDELLHTMQISEGSSAVPGIVALSLTGWGFVEITTGLRDMHDDIARELAYLLVKTLPEDYAYPEDLEVNFDDLPYPLLN